MTVIRHRVEDFAVEELPRFEPSGEGSHTYLWIEKRGVTTDRLLRDLAARTGKPSRELGYAGRKDRHAVTRQWFSVPGLEPADALALELDGAEVLKAELHPHKLRVGQLRGNRFRLVVRQVTEEAAGLARERFEAMAIRGMPNRYGAQRFGRFGGNVEEGAAILRGKIKRLERRRASLMVSALQAAVFNRVLEQRQEALGEVFEGDVVFEHGTGSFYWANDLEREQARAERFEISPTGPIFGTKMKRPRGLGASLEAAAMEEFDLPPVTELRAPRGVRLFGTRRSLRVRPEKARCEWRDNALHLEFELPSGSYATVLVEELFPEGVEDLGGRGEVAPTSESV